MKSEEPAASQGVNNQLSPKRYVACSRQFHSKILPSQLAFLAYRFIGEYHPNRRDHHEALHCVGDLRRAAAVHQHGLFKPEAKNDAGNDGDSKSAKKDEKAVMIKIRTPTAGDVVLVTKDEKIEVVTKIMSKDGKLINEDRNVSSEVAEYEQTIVKREGSRPPEKVERKYSKWQITEAEKAKDVPHGGKILVIERKNDKFGFTLKDGGKLDRAVELALIREFADKSDGSEEVEKLLVPSTEVKPGETWNVDMAKIVKEMSKAGKVIIDASKSTGTGKLLKTYKNEGALFGKMTFHMTMPVTEFMKMKLADGSTVHIAANFDICIDGTLDSGKMTTKTDLDMTAPHPLAGAKGGPPSGTTMVISMSKQDTITHSAASK